MSSTAVSQKHGVNPSVILCEWCNKDYGLALAGKTNLNQCWCGKKIYGLRYGVGKAPVCSDCGRDASEWQTIETDVEMPRQIAQGLCDDCIKKKEDHAKIVSGGGVYWKCPECNSSGVIKPNDYTKVIREHLKLDKPDESGIYKPCGVEFQKNDCPVCPKGGTNG